MCCHLPAGLPWPAVSATPAGVSTPGRFACFAHLFCLLEQLVDQVEDVVYFFIGHVSDDVGAGARAVVPGHRPVYN